MDLYLVGYMMCLWLSGFRVLGGYPIWWWVTPVFHSPLLSLALVPPVTARLSGAQSTFGFDCVETFSRSKESQPQPLWWDGEARLSLPHRSLSLSLSRLPRTSTLSAEVLFTGAGRGTWGSRGLWSETPASPCLCHVLAGVWSFQSSDLLQILFSSTFRASGFGLWFVRLNETVGLNTDYNFTLKAHLSCSEWENSFNHCSVMTVKMKQWQINKFLLHSF